MSLNDRLLDLLDWWDKVWEGESVPGPGTIASVKPYTFETYPKIIAVQPVYNHLDKVFHIQYTMSTGNLLVSQHTFDTAEEAETWLRTMYSTVRPDIKVHSYASSFPKSNDVYFSSLSPLYMTYDPNWVCNHVNAIIYTKGEDDDTSRLESGTQDEEKGI